MPNTFMGNSGFDLEELKRRKQRQLQQPGVFDYMGQGLQQAGSVAAGIGGLAGNVARGAGNVAGGMANVMGRTAGQVGKAATWPIWGPIASEVEYVKQSHERDRLRTEQMKNQVMRENVAIYSHIDPEMARNELFSTMKPENVEKIKASPKMMSAIDEYIKDAASTDIGPDKILDKLVLMEESLKTLWGDGSKKKGTPRYNQEVGKQFDRLLRSKSQPVGVQAGRGQAGGATGEVPLQPKEGPPPIAKLPEQAPLPRGPSVRPPARSVASQQQGQQAVFEQQQVRTLLELQAKIKRENPKLSEAIDKALSKGIPVFDIMNYDEVRKYRDYFDELKRHGR